MSSNTNFDRPQRIDVKNLLEATGYDVEDSFPSTLPDVSAETRHVDAATPIVLIDDEEIGDQDDLMRWLARNAH